MTQTAILVLLYKNKEGKMKVKSKKLKWISIEYFFFIFSLISFFFPFLGASFCYSSLPLFNNIFHIPLDIPNISSFLTGGLIL